MNSSLGREECPLTDLAILERLREHLPVSVQDPGPIVETVEIRHIVTLDISSKYGKIFYGEKIF